MDENKLDSGDPEDSGIDWKTMENIRVICRFRPIADYEHREEKQNSVKDDTPTYKSAQEVKLNRTQHSEPANFVLDHIFPSSTNQPSIYKLVGLPMVQAALEGYNATIFAYGQTGSGKTFTMFGPENRKALEEMGIVQRCLNFLFQQLNKKCANNTSSKTEVREWDVSMECLQIYKDTLLDLLEPNKTGRLEIKHHALSDEPYVTNLKKVSVSTLTDVLTLLSESHRNRIVAGHMLNAASSRSHMVIMLTIVQHMSDGSIKKSKLNFGDLAGSEDVKRALGDHPDPERLKEAQKINLSLTMLTTAISNLSNNQRPSYRSSALTHVLQNSLGGNSKTTIIVACSPHIINRDETIRTLRFAATAKTVKNKAKINKELTPAQLKLRIEELERENQKLKIKVMEYEQQLKSLGVNIQDLFSSPDTNGTSTASTPQSQTSSNNKKTAPPLTIESDVASANISKASKVLNIDTQDVQIKQSSSQSLKTLIEQLKTLENQLAEHLQLNTELKDKVAQQETELSQLTEELNKTKESLELAENKALQADKDKEALSRRIDQLTNEVVREQKNQEKQNKQLDEQITRLRKNVQMEKDKNTELLTKFNELQLTSDDLKAENKSLSAQLNSLQKENKKLSESNKSLDNNKLDSNGVPQKPPSSLAKHHSLSPSMALDLSNIKLEEEEKDFTPAELLLNRFGVAGLVNDYRLTPEQRMQKTSQIMQDVSGEMGEIVNRWHAMNKVVLQDNDRKSSSLIFQVRQIIGHFNIAMGKLKEQEESFQNDLKLEIKRKDAEIKQLKEDNKRVLQLQDDLDEKDEIIKRLQSELNTLRSERDQLQIQSHEVKTLLDDVQSQVHYLEDELQNQRATKPQPPSIVVPISSPKASKPTLLSPKGGYLSPRRKSSLSNWRRQLQKNSHLDCLDRVGLWWTAIAVDEDDVDKLLIRYDGWGDQYDEWIEKDSERLAPHKSKAIGGKESKGVLYDKLLPERNGVKIVREGFMSKEGGIFKTTRQRYFVLLENGKLQYYDKYDDKECIFEISVDDMMETKRTDWNKKNAFGWELITKDRTWKFTCASEKEVLDWIHAIHAVKNGLSPEEFDA